MNAHPNAALLDLCRRLGEMQAEWQRLYDLTSEEEKLTTPADHEWARYASTVWPCIGPYSERQHAENDLPAELLQHQAQTPEGLAAKAAAVIALDDAASYTMDCHNLSWEMARSVLEDAAGAAFRPLGADAQPVQNPTIGQITTVGTR